MAKLTTKVILLTVLWLLIASLRGQAAPGGASQINAQRGLQVFLSILKPTELSGLMRDFAGKNPKASREFLLLLQEEMKPALFNKTVVIYCEHPQFLKRFLDAAVKAIDVPGFSKVMDALAKEPKAIRAITLESLLRLNDQQLIQAVQITARYPKALKIFSLEIDDKVLAQFAMETYRDREAMALIIETIQKNGERIKALVPGVDIYKIAGIVLKQLDKNYFKELFVPDNATPEMLIRGLSLTDGIIDLEGHEEIDLAGVGQQTLKMLDSPGFIFSFLWNIYFGDKSSQVAINFRKELIVADKKDGIEDRKVNLRILAKSSPEEFLKLRDAWLAILTTARFRDKMSNPEIILDPMVNFMKDHEARVVADTIAPIFIRSLEIRPQLAKIVLAELPPEIIGALLNNVIEHMATTTDGKAALKRLTLSVWKEIPDSQLQKAVRSINDKEPVALQQMIVPVMLVLKADDLVSVTKNFMKYEEAFFDFNHEALKGISDAGMVPVADAATQNPDEFHQILRALVDRLPASEQNNFIQSLGQNPQSSALLQILIQGTDTALLKRVGDQFDRNPQSPKISTLLPESLVQSVIKSYERSR